MSSADLVSTVVSAHRRCSSEGNGFNLDRVLICYEEVKEERAAAIAAAQAARDSSGEAEAEADVLLHNIANLRDCGAEKLQQRLLEAQQQLHLKNGQIHELSKLKDEITAEVGELTACLFEEANKMVNESNRRRHKAEKEAAEATSALELLRVEIGALKRALRNSGASSISRSNTTLGLSTPPAPGSMTQRLTSLGVVQAQSRERNGSSLGTLLEDQRLSFEQVDSQAFHEFLVWLEKPVLDGTLSQFYRHIINFDVEPCLSFCQPEYKDVLLESCKSNSVIIETLPKVSTTASPATQCQLSRVVRLCEFKLKFTSMEGSPKMGESFTICRQARNRIAAVCELFTFLRYISQSILKSQSIDLFLQLTELQKTCCLARLGYLS